MKMSTKLICGDALTELKKLEADSIDLLCTDPPYGIKFMSKSWDKALPDIRVWKECLRVLKPGSFGFVMSIPRADCLSRMIISLEDAGFLVNFTPIFWAYASGFPKATNISKMVDKRGGTYTDCQRFSKYLRTGREAKDISLKEMNEMFGYVAGCSWWESLNPNNFRFPNNKDYLRLKELLGLDDRFDYLQGVVGSKVGEQVRGNAGFSNEQVPRPWKEHIGEQYDITSPATPQAKALDGSYGGFQPKPAVEVIIVCMKPLSEKTFVDQALKNRHGISWLDDCRIPYENEGDKEQTRHNWKPDSQYAGDKSLYELGTKKINTHQSNRGRFPANLICSDDVLNDGRVTKSIGGLPERGKIFNQQGKTPMFNYGDVGSFARYFDLDKWAQKKLTCLVFNQGLTNKYLQAGCSSALAPHSPGHYNNKPSNEICQVFKEKIKQLPESAQKTFPFLIVPKASKREKNRGLDGLPLFGIEASPEEGTPFKPAGAFDGGAEKAHSVMSNYHPSVKPVKLMSYLITLGSREGDVVLDPFMGSGTTGVACKLLNRGFIGYEIDASYYEIALRRCQGYLI